MTGRPEFRVRYRRRVWLVLLLPAAVMLQKCYDAVTAYRAGELDAAVLIDLVGFGFLTLIMVVGVRQRMRSDVLTADGVGHTVSAVAAPLVQVPWTAVVGVRLRGRGLLRRVVVTIAEPRAVRPVSATTTGVPVLDRLDRYLLERRRLTVPLVATDQPVDRVAEALAGLAAHGCPVVRETD